MSMEEEIDQSATTDTEDSCESQEDSMLSGLSEEQKKVLQEKMKQLQNQFSVFNSNLETQKIQDVMRHVKTIDETAAKLAIDSCRGNELLAIKRFIDEEGFKQTIIDMSSRKIPMDLDSILYQDKKQELRDALKFDPDEDSDNDEGDVWVMKLSHRRRSSGGSDESDSEHSGGRKRAHKSDGKSDHKLPRLNLDDALIMLASLQTQPAENVKKKEENASSSSNKEPADEESDTVTSDSKSSKSSQKDDVLSKETALFRKLSGSASKNIPGESLKQLGWSSARIKAFHNREKNPNMYYYRFNDPGEKQATGKWSPKEKALFFRLIQENGVDYQWGIFSMKIPGRVGYQCSNYYRQLIKEGEIQDENYSMNDDGKLVFNFRDKDGKSTLYRSKKKKRTRRSDVYIREEKEEDIVIEKKEEDTNVLPDYLDPMTMEPVVKPTISPYGHVMGYDSWVKILNRDPKNVCPFTKKKLTRRSLVKLNSENIETYRDKIVTISPAFTLHE